MKKYILIAIAALCLVACQRQPRLVILHTNDTHSHFEPGRGEDDFGKGGVIERAAFVDSVRQAEGESRVLLLHAGDFNQGSSYYSQFKGELEIETVNAMRYDCVTLGNHEFDNGIESLASRLAKVECPVVCANMVVDSLPIAPYVQPYVIVERGGMKIGIIGLAAQLKGNVLNSVASGIEMKDNEETVNRYADELKDKCDYVIVLSHSGMDKDCELVPSIHGVDLIVGGHTHTFIEKPVIIRDATGKKVPVVQDGCFGLEMGKVEVF